MKSDVSSIRVGVLSNNGHSPWLKKLAETLGELGELSIYEEIALEEGSNEYCDLIMVDASGLQMRLSERVLWLNARYPNVPIVVLTSSPTWRWARAVLQAGASDYMSRSIEGSLLLNRCRSLLQHHP